MKGIHPWGVYYGEFSYRLNKTVWVLISHHKTQQAALDRAAGRILYLVKRTNSKR